MGTLERFHKIKRETLSSEFYFQSLLEQGYTLGLLSDAALEKVQGDCFLLLAEKTKRYNSGDSSSVPIETAQNLLASIMFTIGTALKTYKSPDDAIAALQADGANALQQQGRKLIERMVKQAKHVHSCITSNLFQTENVFYASTLVDGIKGFFKLYYPEFAAQEIHITADYPAHHPMKRLLGIEFIRKYLECLYYENLFCTLFSPQDVHHLLCGYDLHYRELLFNLYEPVLSVAIGCILSGREVHSLELTPSSLIMLRDLFQGKTRAQSLEILTKATEQLGEQLLLSDSLKRYIIGSLPGIAASIELQNHVFLLPKYPEHHPKLLVSFGEKMDNEAYRKVLEEIIQCRHWEDKRAMIKSEIQSLADLEDIFLDAELCEEELFSILGDLNPGEVMALAQKYPPSQAVEWYGMRENEIAFCEGLHRYLAALPAKQQEIMKQANAMLEEPFRME